VKAVRTVATALALAAATSAARADELARLFPKEADLFLDGPPGLVRLVLPPEVLAACRPDLSDVRIADAAGREVPFFVDAGRAPAAPAPRAERIAVEVLSVERTLETPEGRAPEVREVYEIAVTPPATAPEVADGGATLELVVESSLPRFVRHALVSEAAPGGGGAALASAPLFRLDAETARLRIALPRAAFPVRLEITGHEAAYLEPAFHLERSRESAPTAQAEVPLVLLGAESRDGTSWLELARPPGLVPDGLRLGSSTQSFSRRVSVYDVQAGAAERRIGARTLFRAALDPPVEALEIPLAPALGDRLRIAVEDGDSPPLEAPSLLALVRRPTLVFALSPPADAAAPAATLRFGGGRALRPRYDLIDLWQELSTHDETRRALADVDGLAGLARSVVRLGPVRANRAFDAAPALAFARQPGATVDRRLFERRRSVTVPASFDGLVRLRLAADDVAHARDDLADLRVVDGDGRQWPYLLDAEAARAWADLDVMGPVAEGPRQRSRFTFALPASPVVIDRLELLPGTGFLHRAFRLEARSGERSVTLASGALDARDERPQPITIAFAPARVDSLALVVDDGDEAPLALRHAGARLVLPELYLVAPPGRYALLLGDPGAAAPRYELAHVRDVVLAVSSVTADLGPPAANPEFSARARLTAGDAPGALARRAAVWAALVGAVGVLAFVTLRLVRAEGEPRG